MTVPLPLDRVVWDTPLRRAKDFYRYSPVTLMALTAGAPLSEIHAFSRTNTLLEYACGVLHGDFSSSDVIDIDNTTYDMCVDGDTDEDGSVNLEKLQRFVDWAKDSYGLEFKVYDTLESMRTDFPWLYTELKS